MQVSKWGNSLAVRIPRSFAEQAGLRENGPIDVSLADGKVLIEAVGVPEMTPVVAARLRPAGKLPELICHVYPGVPPIACKLVEYAVPEVPEGRDEDVMVSVGTCAVREMDAEAVAVWTGLLVSLAFTLKL